MPKRKSAERLVRTYIRYSDHKRLVLFAKRNEMDIIDAYRLLIRFFLDHDGRTKPEADKTSIKLTLKTFQLLEEKLEESGATADVLIRNLLTASKDVFKTRARMP